MAVSTGLPFTCFSNDYNNTSSLHFSEVFGLSLCDGDVILLPGVSAYVGADIRTGMLYCSLHEREYMTMLIDIGTNGEMALGNRNKILTPSTAAGPALEGGNIQYGTGSIKGAISSLAIHKGKISCQTIGNASLVGICGSGVIDIVASCCKSDIIDETGKFSDDYEAGAIQVARTEEDQPILFTQKDIREVQLAKSAHRSGVEILMQCMGITPKDIGCVYMAGGFENGIHIDSAVTIGLLPGGNYETGLK